MVVKRPGIVKARNTCMLDCKAEFTAVRHGSLPKDVGEVRFGGAWRHTEAPTNLGIGHVFNNESGDVAFGSSQAAPPAGKKRFSLPVIHPLSSLARTGP